MFAVSFIFLDGQKTQNDRGAIDVNVLDWPGSHVLPESSGMSRTATAICAITARNAVLSLQAACVASLCSATTCRNWDAHETLVAATDGAYSHLRVMSHPINMALESDKSGAVFKGNIGSTVSGTVLMTRPGQEDSVPCSTLIPGSRL